MCYVILFLNEMQAPLLGSVTALQNRKRQLSPDDEDVTRSVRARSLRDACMGAMDHTNEDAIIKVHVMPSGDVHRMHENNVPHRQRTYLIFLLQLGALEFEGGCHQFILHRPLLALLHRPNHGTVQTSAHRT